MMKRFLMLTILLFCFQSALAQEVETRYYNPGQTQAEVETVFHQFAEEYKKGNFQVNVMDKVSDHDYTIEFILKADNGLTSFFRLRYQFFDNRVVCTVVKAQVVNAKNAVFPLTPDNANKSLKDFYFIMKNNFADSIFKYLKIENNTQPVRKAS